MIAIRLKPTWIVLAGLLACAPVASAQTTISDTFTGTTATNPWIPLGDACLTASTTAGTSTALGKCSSTVDGTVDTAGSGALRLTPGGTTTNQTGGIISNTSMAFPSNQGIQVTFTTYTYGGNSYKGTYGSSPPATGADGIGFYLLDATSIAAAGVTPALGAFGGSLGYSCSQGKGAGMTYGYIGLGMDEFGNYLNSGDNTNTGVYNLLTGTGSGNGNGTSPGPIVTNGSGTTGSGGTEFQPGRIGLRGYGRVTAAYLQSLTSGSYTVQTSDVENTCSTGSYSYVVTPGYTTYVYAYTYTTGSGHSQQTNNYSGTLYTANVGRHSTTYTAAGATISGSTSSATDGYTGSDNAPYGLAGGTYYPITVASTPTVVAAVMSTPQTVPDYAVISNANMVLSQSIANESATSRVPTGTASTSAVPINYKLQITSTGLLSFWYSYNGGTYNPVITGQDISSSNGTMPSSFLFGFGASTGGGTNVHEITCFLATPANVSASSAGLNVQQAGSVRSGTEVYLAFYHPNNWWGQLEAQELMVNGNTVTINSVANWDASCVLTGGECPAMETSPSTPVTVTAQTSRTLITWSGTAGIPFTEGRLTATELGWLEAGTTTGTTGATNMVDYLSGGRTNEVPSGGATGTKIYRDRTSVLGDIIDASPVWVGAPSGPYAATWADKLHPADNVPENATGVTTYPTFVTNQATRQNVVYMGANDGFLHAFQSGSYDATGVNFNSATDNGQELFAYMPQAVLQNIHSTTGALDYSSPNYAHNYFVDATPGTGDLFYSNGWHTWLVGGLGPGGNAIYAIDVTSPTTVGVGQIIGEWGANTGTTTAPATGSTNPVTSLSAATGTNALSCTNVTNCAANLGQTYGTPQIRRLHNGEWGIIFGNGLNSASGSAGIYVMTVSSSGSIDKVYYLDTGVVGTAAKPDGIAYVTPVDLDGDHITDYVYAGDVYGNVWRFDLTSDTATNWAVTNYGSSTPAKPLFTTPTVQACTPPGGTGCTQVSTNQPITTALVVLSVAPSSVGLPRVMVEFGTGSVTPQTTTAAIQYSPGQQALYGIWDWNVGATGTAGASYAGLATGPTSAITTSQLLSQSVTGQTSASTSGSGVGYRTVSNTPICFMGTNCGTATGVYGWYLNLPGYAGNNGVGGADQTEQVVYSPIGSEGAFIVNTTVPANNAPLTCTVSNAQGWTMALNPATGGAFQQSFFSAMGGGSINVNGQPVSGIAVNGTGSPSVVTAVGNPYLISQTVTGTGTINQINPQPSSGGRLTWIQLH